MPHLILHFDLHTLTDSAGNPIEHDGHEQLVPVLVRANQVTEGRPGQAYCTENGWADPANGNLYSVNGTPPNSAGHDWGSLLRNDILECDEDCRGCN